MSKSSTIMTELEYLPNPSPGEILAEEFMKPGLPADVVIE